MKGSGGIGQDYTFGDWYAIWIVRRADGLTITAHSGSKNTKAEAEAALPVVREAAEAT